MTILYYSKNKYYFDCAFNERHLPKDAGFFWETEFKMWCTNKHHVAFKLINHIAIDHTISKEFLNYFTSFSKKPKTSLALKKDYKPFQLAGIEYIKDKKVSVIGDEMGLGKTIQAIGLINLKKYKKVLIICPASLKYNWFNELNEWLEFKVTIKIIENSKDTISKDLTISSYDMVKDKLLDKFKKQKYDLIVLDESHYLKNLKAKRTKNILGSYPKKKESLCDTAAQIVLLSGTLVPSGRPIEIYPILYNLAPEIIDKKNYIHFANRYCAGFHDKWGYNAKGASNLEELNFILRSNILIRRLKKDVLNQLPQKRYQIIEIGKTNKLEFKDFSLSNLESYISNVSIDEMSALRQNLALEKIDTCINYIDEILETSEQKIVVFAHHVAIIERLEAGLAAHTPLTITGKTPVKKRQSLIDAFQKDNRHQIIIDNIAAMGVGFNLTASSHVIFVEFSWTPGDNEQCIDRCHRIRQEDRVLAQFLVYKGTLESHIINTLIKKQKNIISLLNKKKGVL